MRRSAILPALGKALALALVLVWSLMPIALIVTSSFKLDRDIFSTRTPSPSRRRSRTTRLCGSGGATSSPAS
jgi:ABC-type glycerol-3-phosphate transport system permease component